MRKLNDMFHLEGERLVKTSNGQFVPDDEPLFILRGRDAVAADAIEYYISLCHIAGTPEDRLSALDAVVAQFKAYASKKVPGSTHGR
jgi:hypothetical protein